MKLKNGLALRIISGRISGSPLGDDPLEQDEVEESMTEWTQEFVEDEYDSEYDLEEEHCSALPEEFYDNFGEFSVLLAKHYIDMYFANKKMHCGGRVSKSLLFSPQTISLILNTPFIEGIDRIYEVIAKKYYEKETKGKVSNHVVLVLNLLDECHDMRIPTAFKAGMILANLKFCRGCNID